MPIYRIYHTIAIRTVSAIDETSWYIKVFAIFLSALAPIKNYIHFLIVLLIVDAVTAIYYQYKGNLNLAKKKNISKHINLINAFSIFFSTIESNKLRRTVEKLFAYILGLIICFFFDKIIFQITPLEGMPLKYFSITNISVVLISSVELTSILSNLGKITNNPIYSRIIKILNKKIDDKIDKTDV